MGCCPTIVNGAPARTVGKIPSGYVELPAPDTTTSAVFVDIVGLSVTIAIATATRILGWLSWECETVGLGTPAVGGFAVSIAAADGQEIDRYLSGTNDLGAGPSQYRSAVLSPGTYTVKGRWRRVSGAATLQLNHAQLSAMGMEA